MKNFVLTKEQVAKRGETPPYIPRYERRKGSVIKRGHKLTGQVWYNYGGFTCVFERDFWDYDNMLAWVKSAPVYDEPLAWERKRWILS